jgi:gliding motility-associated-like protein
LLSTFILIFSLLRNLYVTNLITSFRSNLLLVLLICAVFPSVYGQYCAPQYSASCQGPSPYTADFINNFSTSLGVTNISNNNSGCNFQPDNFIYYPNQTVTATQGCSFNVSMQCGPEFTQGFAIWIDWNQDLDYNDVGEMVFSNAPTNNVITGTIQVPATAALGTTRMRVRCCYIVTPMNACTLQGVFGGANYGEVEEYNVTVVSNTASVVQVSDQTICAGTSTQITATAQGIIRWYLNQNSTNQIALGPTFTTPVLNTTTTYWVQATFGPCTTPRVPVVITVVPPFAVTIAASQNPVCAGTPFTLTASSAQTGLTYQWTPAAAFNNASQNPSTLSISANTTFNVVATNAAGCTGNGSLAVTVLPAPTLNVVAATPSFCPGQSTTLTASNAGPTYTWSPSTGLSSTTGAIVTASPATTTTYTVTSPAAAGICAASGTVTVTVNPVPAVNAGLNAAICAGASTTLAASGATSYSWSPTIGLSASNSASPTANPISTTTYTVTGTSALGCTSTDEVIVTVNPIPLANPGSGAANCSGTGAQLNGSGGTTYQWSPATGLSSSTIANPLATPLITTNYTLTVTSASGCVSLPSAPIAVTVFQQPAAPVITASGPLTFCQGGSVQLSVPASSQYLWSNGQTTQSITVSQSGNYTVQIVNANGCSSPVSTATNVTVNALPAVPTITASGPLTFCDGGSVSLTSSAAASYSWNTGVTAQTIVAQNSGTFIVTVTNANGCQASSATTTVTEHPPLVALAITASGPTSFCPGSSVTLTAPASASYLWSTGATTQNITSSITGEYTVVVTDANGCVAPPSFPVNTTLYATPATPTITSVGTYPVCFGQTAQLSSSAATQYLWSSGSTSQTISVTTAGDYSVRITDVNGCQSLSSAPFNVSFLPLPAAPIISAVGPSTFCNGETVDLQAIGNGTVNWNNGASGAFITVGLSGQYTATLTDLNGCVSNNSSPIQVNVLATPANATIQTSGPTDICEGDSVMLTANAAPSYAWSTGATSQSIWVYATGTYSVTINGNSCPPAIDQASKDVQVRPIPVPEIFADRRRDCMPVEISFGMNTPGIGPFSYLWRFGDGTISTIALPEHVYTRPGFYDVTLTLTDIIGCVGQVSEKDFIEVLEKAMPVINIVPRITTFSSPTVTLISQTLNADSLVWDLGILGVFTGDTVMVTLPDTGYYPLEYTVTTGDGCEVILKDRMQMIEDFNIFVPNGFSPNEDDLNDTFLPICTGISSKGYQFMVFNRWGEEVFSSNKLGEGWDGNNGHLGVYTWKIVARSLLGDDKILTGQVTLLD